MFPVTDRFLYLRFARTFQPKLLLTVKAFIDNTPKKKHGNTMDLCSRTAWQRNRGCILFIIFFFHFKQSSLLSSPPPNLEKAEGLRFWLAGDNTSPLNQDWDLPLCSFTCKKLIKKTSFRTLFGFRLWQRGKHLIGHTVTGKRCLTTDKVKTYGLLCYTFPSEWVGEGIKRKNGA